jgi:hypothetical protein
VRERERYIYRPPALRERERERERPPPHLEVHLLKREVQLLERQREREI